ncbi:hypothetical protein DAT35_10645 [Vitiosangium sp. GDMCC 1.1324]|nr:hypothetical protein DAT35_10645 [Vitiosangium sp. GDMCC 1.1324]
MGGAIDRSGPVGGRRRGRGDSSFEERQRRVPEKVSNTSYSGQDGSDEGVDAASGPDGAGAQDIRGGGVRQFEQDGCGR